MIHPSVFNARVTTCLVSLLAAGISYAAPKPTPEVESESAAMVFARASSSVVMVRVETANGQSQGSGVIVGRNKVITNAHVVNGARKVTVTIKGKNVEARVSATSVVARDLALLDVDTTGGGTASLRLSTSLAVGERVFAIGNPRGYEQTLTEGLISALRKEGDAFVIQTSAAISPGSSGGGLFDSRGRLVGITTLTRADAQNLNFANPAEWVKALIAGSAGPVSDAGMAAQWSVTARPEALLCDLTDTSRWGIFSEGLELLEASPVKGAVLLTALDKTQPKIMEGRVSDNLVLKDLSRKHQVALFRTRDNQLVFVSFEDQGDLRLTLGNIVSERGEPRLVTRTGLCTASTAESAQKSFLARASENNTESNCEDGKPAGCYADAQALEGGPRFVLLKKSCRYAHQRGCREAIAMAESVGDQDNVRTLKQWVDNHQKNRWEVPDTGAASASPEKPAAAKISDQPQTPGRKPLRK